MYYWIGKREDGRWELFKTDTRGEGTAEATGYEAVIGPFNERSEAEAECAALND